MSTEARNESTAPQQQSEHIIVPNTPHEGFKGTEPETHERAQFDQDRAAVRESHNTTPETSEVNPLAAFLRTKLGKGTAVAAGAAVIAGAYAYTHQDRVVGQERITFGQGATPSEAPVVNEPGVEPTRPTDLPTIVETPKSNEQANVIHFPSGLTSGDTNPEYAGEEALAAAYKMKRGTFDMMNPDIIIPVTNMLEPRFEYAVNKAKATPEMITVATDTMREQMFDTENQDSALARQLTEWAKNTSGTELSLTQVSKFDISAAQVGGEPSQKIVTTFEFNYGGTAKSFEMTVLYKTDGSGDRVFKIVSDKEVPVGGVH